MEEHAVAGRARRRGAKVLALQASRAAGEGLRTLGARSSRQHVGLSCPRAKQIIACFGDGTVAGY